MAELAEAWVRLTVGTSDGQPLSHEKCIPNLLETSHLVTAIFALSAADLVSCARCLGFKATKAADIAARASVGCRFSRGGQSRPSSVKALQQAHGTGDQIYFSKD